MSFELRHKLFNNLDNPTRILFWTFPEALVILGPLFVGMATGYGFTSLTVSILGFYSMRAWERRGGKQNLNALFYWYLPHNKAKLKVTPPSYIREYFG